MSRDDYDFQGQLKYEHLQFFFRRHWMRFLRPFFSFIPFGLLLFVLFFAAGQFVAVVDAHYLSAFYAFLTMLVAIFYINAFCLQIIHHFFDLVVVTDCRIVVVRKTAFIKNDSDAIDLTKIQDIGVQSHGVISNYMGYGNLIITLSTSSPPVVVHYVPDPHFYLERCNRVKREYILNRHEKRSGSSSDLKNGTAENSSNYLQDINSL